ncbi:MAG: carbohydrate-binding domain-containing protein [Hoylesella shahii]|uniref:carbohydrate-binding domain-containing protein n=1 Tax=Hoylesella shahii TaxID=228603 RepID=UPI003F9F042A
MNFVSSSVTKVTLNVTSSAYNGIYTLAGTVAHETTFNITSAVDGIKTIDNPITLKGGTYTIKSVVRGIRTISSTSTYTTSSSAHNIIVNDGTYTITTTSDDGEGFKAYATGYFPSFEETYLLARVVKTSNIILQHTFSCATPSRENRCCKA